MPKNQPIIEEITEENQSYRVHESIIGVSHISNVTVKPDNVAHTIRNILIQSGKFENVRFIGNNVIEVMFNGLWYNIEVNGSIGNLFI